MTPELLLDVVVPAPDPVGLPAPPWIMEVLLVGTFILHLVPMNLTLGGGFVAAWAAWRGQGDDEEARHHAALAVFLGKVLPVSTAFAITLGVAPLLFLQVTYGPAFFTSSILMAWPWLAALGLLLVVYYGAYGYQASAGEPGPRAAALAGGIGILTAGIAFLFVNDMSLMLRPEVWGEMYEASDRGLHLNLSDPTINARFLHFLVAAVAAVGLAVAIRGRLGSSDPAREAWYEDFGTRLFTGATLFEIPVGLVFLVMLPARVRGLFLGGSLPDTALLWTAVALAIGAVVAIRRRLWTGIGLISATVCGMAVVRHRVREAMLEPSFDAAARAVNPQWGAMALFVLTLVAGGVCVAWMLRALWRGRPEAPD